MPRSEDEALSVNLTVNPSAENIPRNVPPFLSDPTI
jgi:hypothetical protein